MTLHWAGASGLPLCLLGACFTSLGLSCDCPGTLLRWTNSCHLGLSLRSEMLAYLSVALKNHSLILYFLSLSM